MSASTTTLTYTDELVNDTVNDPAEETTMLTDVKTAFNNAFSATPATGHTHNGIDSAKIASADGEGEGGTNDSGVILAVGDLVYISGYDSTNTRPYFKKAVSNFNINTVSLYARYVITTGGANAALVYAHKRARVTGMATTGGTIGRPCWLSATAGGFSTSIPASGYGAQVIGEPESIGASGVMRFNIQGPIPWSLADQI